ncbi:MAG: tRNA pseudouridine(55) synthase TruB [Thermoleophilia bacterium]
MADAVAAALWLVDKPAGPTSHDVVATVRRRLGRKVKVGHTGTLDPFATGLLVLMVGRATRLAPLLTGLDKTYLATLRTGFTSESGDPEGPVARAGEPAAGDAIAAALPAFIGMQRQRVPALSAVKVGGERLYARTRRGEETELPERDIAVRDLRLVEDLGDGEAVLEVRCSAGTYVRRLASDIGERLGCGAYLTALRRTAVGAMSVDDAVAPDEVEREGGIAPLAALPHLARRELDTDGALEVAHGRWRGDAAGGNEPVALVRDGRLVAVARPDEAGVLRAGMVLEDPR